MSRDVRGGNNPPIELSREDATTLLAMVERDLGQALSLLSSPDMSRNGQEALVGHIEALRPLRLRLTRALED